MTARPGERAVAALFADVHYFYSPPTAKLSHHRFDKNSYVYLFEDVSQSRERIEIANNAGTLDQDAFNGYMDGAHVQYSYKHSTLVTLTVGDQNNQQNSGTPADTQEWYLPTFDLRNENKYMYKLNTVDIYFRTNEDALQFVNGIRKVLPHSQVEIRDEPIVAELHGDYMSPTGFSEPLSQPCSHTSYWYGSPASCSQSQAPAPTSNCSPYVSVPANHSPNPPAYTETPEHIPVTQYENFSGSAGMLVEMATPGPSLPVSIPYIYLPNAPRGPTQIKYAQNATRVTKTKSSMTDYSIHQQVYIPMEYEAKHHESSKQPAGKLKERVSLVENGVNGLLKKLEKRVG